MGGTYHIHHVLLVAPLLALPKHLFEQSLSSSIRCQLEILRTLVRGQGQQDNPLAVVAEEGCHRVLTHIGGNSQRIHVVLLEEGLGIHLRRVANVSTLGVGDDEVVRILFLQILDGGLESHDAVYAVGLIEGQVGLVCHAVGCCGINDEGIELAKGAEDVVFAVLSLCLVDDALGYLVQVCIETYAEKRLLLFYLLYQFFPVHFSI